MARPCIHGDVCRAHIRERGCILRNTCPKCEHYAPEHYAPEQDPVSDCRIWILVLIAVELIELLVSA